MISIEQFFSTATMDLLACIKADNAAGVVAALKAGGNVNEIGQDQTTPLIYAVIELDYPLVIKLLSMGGDPNAIQADGYSALTAAYKLSSGSTEIFEALIKNKKSDLNVYMPDQEPMLFHFILNGKIKFLELALKNGADASLLSKAKLPLVIEAAKLEQFEGVRLLVEAGALANSVDAEGISLVEIIKKFESQATDPATTKTLNLLIKYLENHSQPIQEGSSKKTTLLKPLRSLLLLKLSEVDEIEKILDAKLLYEKNAFSDAIMIYKANYNLENWQSIEIKIAKENMAGTLTIEFSDPKPTKNEIIEYFGTPKSEKPNVVGGQAIQGETRLEYAVNSRRTLYWVIKDSETAQSFKIEDKKN